MPGGCAIGTRPVDLPASWRSSGSAPRSRSTAATSSPAPRTACKGGEIKFPKVTVGGTHTALMAASLAHGTSVIENAAREPEIKDVADCLNKMGAKITGAGTSHIVVEGVPKLHGARHRVLPDRIETGTYAMAVAMTGGDVMLENARAGAAADRARRARAGRASNTTRPTAACGSRATAASSRRSR